ncbi:Glycoside hydrolase [Macleaya cordata]|uniref:Glycoside hydrolase n=1 Tax=Macleaya cordata TaxID=56857 RepID=A0A200QG67_MACCD|nr:Glycoside hydrolase [Macleaya cordata]
MVLQSMSHTGIPVAVSVSNEDLTGISSSVLMAESWLRTHVLTHYPATKITTIVVTNNILCNKDHSEIWGLVLPSMKNIYHSLVRWGLEREIKVSTGFSRDCLHPFFNSFKDDLAEKVIKPLLVFLQNSNSTYSVNPPPDFSPVSYKTIKLVDSHRDSMKKVGFFNVIDITVIKSSPEEKKPMKRKLSSMISSKFVDPFPARPTPLPELPPSPIHSSIGYSVPAYVAKSPPSPLMPHIAPSPSMSFSFSPESPPFVVPSNPPEVFNYPPCNPPAEAAPTPGTGNEKGLWCVAKPSVPADELQEAIDYACGEGGADCEEIKPNGSCYNPDTVVAHASYAFNSYWQKNKNSGGSCSFGGTAMIINADPSYSQCRFILSLG